MTEKRFNIIKNELDFYFDVSDTEKRWEIGDVELDNLPVFEDLVDLLNALNDENEQLKKQDKINEDCYIKLLEKYDNLKNENEELKSELMYYKTMLHTQSSR